MSSFPGISHKKMSSLPRPTQSPPPPQQQQSVSNAEDSSIPANPAVPPKIESEDNWVCDVPDEKPELPLFDYLNSVGYLEKCRKYEADYTRQLMAKYFSDKNIYGGDIFDEKTMIDDQIIMSSRWPCTRTFADPVKGFEEQNNCSTSTSET